MGVAILGALALVAIIGGGAVLSGKAKAAKAQAEAIQVTARYDLPPTELLALTTAEATLVAEQAALDSALDSAVANVNELEEIVNTLSGEVAVAQADRDSISRFWNPVKWRQANAVLEAVLGEYDRATTRLASARADLAALQATIVG